tara:strand:+ start:885 stop:1295 length:411 start_codon:yes stop_codon:yes gene_type:complete
MTSVNQNDNLPKAGIAVVREDEAGYSVLCLRFGDTFDLTKGGIEPHETELDAALRETQEEAGITNLDFKWGLRKIRLNNMCFFIACTTEEPYIRSNPETNKKEHESAHWFTLEQAESKLHPDLSGIVEWIATIVGG